MAEFQYSPEWQGPLSGRSFERQTQDVINVLLQGQANLQATATPTSNGLMSAADKTELNAVSIKITEKADNDAVVHKTGNETIDGTKTFNSTLKLPYTAITRQFSKSALRLFGGIAGDSGAGLTLAAPDRATASNVFTLSTGGGTNPDLVGEPSGSLSWGGQPLQTISDERLKTDLGVIPDAVLDAWEDVQWGQFQFLDAVERKGKDARLHLGLIAQRVKAVFEAHGLDACAYGILCHDHAPARAWTEPGETGVHSSPAVDVWTVRYAEALAMEAACQRRCADRLQAQIDALAARIEALEA